MQDLHSFFRDSDIFDTEEAALFQPLTWGHTLLQQENSWEDADIILLGCGEMRGASGEAIHSRGADEAILQFLKMYNWHPAVKVAYAGGIRQGLTTDDTRAALRTVLEEFADAGKIVILIGGSHDLTMQQYEAFSRKGKLINIAVADMLIDLEEAEELNDRSFLMEMLTTQPNFVRHYSHIGFQSYFVQPRTLETLDKLRFDFFRLGKVREQMEDVEPVLRSAQMFSLDMSAIRYSDAPANTEGSPNGFTGDEACMLTRYAGMSSALTSIGIFGFQPEHDQHGMTAKLIAQMIWYFIDGYAVRKMEAPLDEREEFIEFHVSFTSNDAIFLKSKRTNRWWMQLPDNSFIPCSYNDYLLASSNEIPERWLREQERLL